jgi:hypothetical protein
MSMKGKPNTSQFRLPKDPTAFLEGGEADKAEKSPVPSESVGLPPAIASTSTGDAMVRRGRGRVQKIFNFPEDLADRLREEALVRSRDKGVRVTEKDIVVEALLAHLGNR